MSPARGDALVLFGATGDLARKKLFPALYHLSRLGRLDVPVVGVASSEWDDGELARYAAESIRTADASAEAAVVEAESGPLAMVTWTEAP